MKYFDIIGNGSIGLLAAIKIKQNFPKINVRIFGNKEQKYSASIAAGAMANVYSELEDNPTINKQQEKMFKMGIEGSLGWKNFFKEFKINKKIITAANTLVYLKKKSTDFEEKNFNIVKMVTLNDKKGKLLNNKIINELFPIKGKGIESILQINDEFSICSDYLFLSLKKLLKKLNIEEVYKDVKKIKRRNKNITIITEDNNKFYSNKIIVAAGARSSDLFEKKDGILEILQGVGSALIINNIKKIPEVFKNNIIRTVNRGGAQCGLHTVPRNEGKLYLGAGNYITKSSKPFHRFETIKYLFSLFEEEMIGKELSYEMVGDFALGLRPRSADGYPMIGPMKKDDRIFFATATNRAGLTWAPKIAEEIIKWISNKTNSDVISGWGPDRNLIIFGNKEKAIDYFVSSRIAAGIEHKIVNLNNRMEYKKNYINLTKFAKKSLIKINKKYKIHKDKSINPDNWAALLT